MKRTWSVSIAEQTTKGETTSHNRPGWCTRRAQPCPLQVDLRLQHGHSIPNTRPTVSQMRRERCAMCVPTAPRTTGRLRALVGVNCMRRQCPILSCRQLPNRGLGHASTLIKNLQQNASRSKRRKAINGKKNPMMAIQSTLARRNLGGTVGFFRWCVC
jgi:hypothetical protein